MIGCREFLKSFGAGVALLSSGASFGTSNLQTEPCIIDIMRNRERYLIDIRSAEGLRIASYLLRDIQAGNLQGIPNFNTLRLAAWAQAWMAMYGTYTVLDIHSGLRTREHNARVENAATNSLHIPTAGNRFSAIAVNPVGADREYSGSWRQRPSLAAWAGIKPTFILTAGKSRLIGALDRRKLQLRRWLKIVA